MSPSNLPMPLNAATAHDGAASRSFHGLPPLPRGGQVRRDLSPAQSQLMGVGIVALHVAAAWGLMQVSAVREAVLQAAPVFVAFIQPPDAPAPPKPVPPPPPKPAPDLKKPPPPQPLIAAAPSPSPAAFVVPAPPPEPAPAPPLPPVPTAPTTPTAVAAAPAAPAPAPLPAQPRQIPASAIQYLEPPVLDYPRVSRKNGEVGLVTVRASIDIQGGAPRNVQVVKSTGHARLDDAAVTAVQRARFKPYTENGVAVAAWVLIPFNFELEK